MEAELSKRVFEKDGLTYTVRRVVDEDPDLSHLGTFSDAYQDGAIEHGNERLNVYRYFIPENPEYGQQDYERMLAFDHGKWCMVGITVDISIKTKTNWAVPPVVGRASVWGVESDSEESYFTELENEMIREAEADLKNLKAALCKKGGRP